MSPTRIRVINTDTTMTHTLTPSAVGFDGTSSVGFSLSEMKKLEFVTGAELYCRWYRGT